MHAVMRKSQQSHSYKNQFFKPKRWFKTGTNIVICQHVSICTKAVFYGWKQRHMTMRASAQSMYIKVLKTQQKPSTFSKTKSGQPTSILVCNKQTDTNFQSSLPRLVKLLGWYVFHNSLSLTDLKMYLLNLHIIILSLCCHVIN